MADAADYSRVVLVDMDGVLADFDGAVLEELGPKCPGIRRPTKSHRMRLEFEQYADQIRDVTSAPGFFRNLKPMPDALDGWQRLIALDYQPRICSSPLGSHPDCEQEKRDWLTAFLGQKIAEEAYIVANKCACPGIALIDDIPAIECAGATWHHIVFDQPYNRQSPSPYRLCGWGDERLPRLLGKQREPGGCECGQPRS